MMVGICDTRVLFREALAAVVTSRGHEVVCCVSALVEAVRAMEQRRADVILVDASSVDRDSLVLLREHAERGRRVRVLVLTAPRDKAGEAVIAMALKAGLVDGVLDHAVALGTLERAVRGQPPPRPRRPVRQPQHVDSVLTTREHDVISLVLAGHATDSIAASLGVSRSTVHSHVQSILRKLGARNRVEAVNIYLSGPWWKPREVPRS
jgi:two-component system, chemotaxis family, CheB/CheR fusion protein